MKGESDRVREKQGGWERERDRDSEGKEGLERDMDGLGETMRLVEGGVD